MSLDNKKVLVTGGTGSIGFKVVRELLDEGCFVTIYSRDQNKQFVMNLNVSSKRIIYKNGDVCDYPLLLRSMKDMDYVVHCAASKHVSLCEENTDSAIKNNIEGTRNVLNAAVYWGVKKVLLLSTDKSVNPTSVMGATKFLAERLFLEFNKMIPCSIVRLGNVFGSNGSVVPVFRDRILNKLPLVVNDPLAMRYFLTLKEAARFIVDRLSDMEGGEIFVKKMKVMSIKQLAEVMTPEVDYPIEYGHMLEGEKLKETLITQTEATRASEKDGYIVVDPKLIALIPPSPNVEFFTNEEIKEMLKGTR